MLPGNAMQLTSAKFTTKKERERDREHVQKVNGFQVTILLNGWNVNDQMYVEHNKEDRLLLFSSWKIK
jgi:hypothetical protein